MRQYYEAISGHVHDSMLHKTCKQAYERAHTALDRQNDMHGPIARRRMNLEGSALFRGNRGI